jgi:hypothetical protein
MVEIGIDTVWQLFVGAILSSSVIAMTIEKLHDVLSKKRERYFEISKYKVETISKAVPYYNKLAFNAFNFSRELRKPIDKRDYMLCVYRLSNFLYTLQKIRQMFGDIQLDNLLGEKILDGFFSNIFCLITAKFSYLEYSKLSYLVEHDLPYHKFHDNIMDNEKDLYEKFKNWISNEISPECLKDLAEKSEWYSSLLMLELNHVYRLWYGEEPSVELDKELKQYLEKNERKYYDRIKSFHLKNRLSCKP